MFISSMDLDVPHEVVACNRMVAAMFFRARTKVDYLMFLVLHALFEGEKASDMVCGWLHLA